jgi:hypothetical protein
MPLGKSVHRPPGGGGHRGPRARFVVAVSRRMKDPCGGGVAVWNGSGFGTELPLRRASSHAAGAGLSSTRTLDVHIRALCPHQASVLAISSTKRKRTVRDPRPAGRVVACLPVGAPTTNLLVTQTRAPCGMIGRSHCQPCA